MQILDADSLFNCNQTRKVLTLLLPFFGAITDYFGVLKLLSAVSTASDFKKIKVFEYNERISLMDKLKKDLKILLIFAVLSSVLLVTGIPMIIVGAGNGLTVVMVLGIVFTAVNFYACPILWVFYGDMHIHKRIVFAIETEKLRSTPVIASQVGISVEQTEKMTWASEHVVGVAQGVPQDIIDDLRANFNGECSEVGMYLAMARVAHREGYPEIGLYWEKAAYEEAEHAAKFAELLGEVVTDSTKKNLEMRVEAENGATAGKTDLAKRAKALNLDAIHDTVHEMARDEARHGKAFAGLLERYFGNK